MTQLTQARLKSVLHYDQATGIFHWLVSAGSVSASKVAGTDSGRGYLNICVDRKFYRAHRLAFLWMTGSMPAASVDHINGSRADNRWANLREATHQENMQNLAVSTRNRSGLAGVCWDKRDRKWRATINKGRKQKSLGYFDCIAAAYLCYLAAKSQEHSFQPSPRGIGETK